jgi:hypothetical protein
MLIKCHPGIRSARAWRVVTLEARHFQWLIAAETAGRSLVRTGSAINRRFHRVPGSGRRAAWTAFHA